MKSYLKIAGTIVLVIWLLAAMCATGIPYNAEPVYALFYRIGFGSVYAAFIGLPIGTIVWLVVMVSRLSAKKEA